jgi:hypothetical protein
MTTKAFCYRLNASIPIYYSQHDPSIGVALGAIHRKIVSREIYNFDLFIYQEDDMIVKHSHVAGFLYETRKLFDRFPDSIRTSIIGFQRYRRLLRGDGHHQDKWGEQDIMEQELLEETPNFTPICLEEVPYLRVDGNTHQALWMLTQEQILALQEKCSFMNYSNPSRLVIILSSSLRTFFVKLTIIFANREHMSSIQLFDGRFCGMTKLLPPEGLSRFAVNHYYQAKHVSWISVFETDESIKTGSSGTPPCWMTIVNANLELRAKVKDNSTRL